MKDLRSFLTLPFGKQKYQVTEGWKYAEAEQAIHGMGGHGGVDFALPRGTKVFAVLDGWAVASYFFYPVKNHEGRPLLYKEKKVGMGLGYFVQIYHPEADLYTSYGHLESSVPSIKFRKPRKVGKIYWPVGHKIDPQKLKDYPWATFVKKGEVIGFVGDSGLTWGYQDYPVRPDPKEYPSWDETHMHFEVFTRLGSKKKKKYLDPYGIKGEAKDYPDSYRKGLEMGIKGPVLWILDKDGLPKFT